MKSKYVISVEFGDTDPAAIVFYPNFFRWYDASAWHLFLKAGLTLERLRDDFGLLGLPIAEANSRFLKPARFGDSVEITSFADEWRRKTFRIVHEVRNDGDLCASGFETRVCAQRDGGKSIRAVTIPDEIRRSLSTD